MTETTEDVRWHFRKMSPSEINQDPVEREFFGDEPINVRLAREVIQNSLDASIAKKTHADRVAGPPVRVRFSLAGLTRPLPAHRAHLYFEGLSEHLAATDDLDERIRTRASDGSLFVTDVPYIVIEDAGTTGLCGDITQYDDSDGRPASNNDFYWFFRNVGRSGKGATDNGSWGLGKWVMPDVSHASTYIALTKTDRDLLLMGQSILKKHTIGGERFASYGYLAELGDDGLALPLAATNPKHRAVIRGFADDFGITFRHERGLSVVIPFPRIASGDDIDEEGTNAGQLIAAVIHNYFYPIVNGWLEVVVEPGGSTLPITINANTIDQVIRGIELNGEGEWSMESYQRLFKMVRSTQYLDESEFLQLSSPPQANENYEHIGELTDLRPRYETNQLLPFRISTNITSKSGEKSKTSFDVYIQRLDSLDQGHDYYIRGTLSIPEMDFIRGYRALALVVVKENERLAAMLRDSEAPAHTAWRLNTDRVSKRWRAGTRHIRSVRDSVRNILSVLEAQLSGLQKDAFADLFTLDVRNAAQESRSRNRRITDEPTVPRMPRPAFGVHDVTGGFNVTSNSGASEYPKKALLQVAYEMPRGNPLKRYKSLDFKLFGDNALEIINRGCELTEGEQPNQLVVDITDPADFSIAVRGFDKNRDLYVRLDAIVEKNVLNGNAEHDS